MAYDDALFQLGMDLTRSSTAQKEDHGERAPVAHVESAKSTFAARKEARTASGTHLVIDVLGARRLDDLGYIESTLKRCVRAAGGALLHIHLHPTPSNGGVSGVALLTDGNVYFCSWPQADFAQLSFFSRGSVKPERALTAAAELFRAREAVIRTDRREKPAPMLPPVRAERARTKPRARLSDEQARVRAA
jgi:S-adenosylmethionine decarboxylase